MSSIYFKVPSKEDLKYRQKWMMDPDTMSYNAGYDVDYSGYNKETGTIYKSDEDLLIWYDKWIGHEPDRYFRYIYTDDIDEPIGEIYYYPNNNTHHMGILIQSKYRGSGYSYEALMELERIAFEENGIDELHDEIPFDRINAINLFKKAGFIQTDKDMMITKDMYINNNVDISISIDKEPYIKKLTDDKVINLTGQSGSGKSTYALAHFNSDEYLVIDTDDIFSDNRFEKSTGINKELGEYFRSKYDILPNCGDDFDTIYIDILDYCKKYNKTIVVDCAQFHCIKDISLLKGTIIVIRTSIDNCYNRTIERFKQNNKDYTEEELIKYQNKKKSLYEWYKQTNKFLNTIDKI